MKIPEKLPQLARIYRHLHTTPIDNVDGFYDLVDYPFQACTRDNRKFLLEKFGKPHAYWTGEFKFHVYSFAYGDAVFFVLTSGNKGTCIEYIGNVDCKTIMQFCKWLVQ